MFRVVSPPIIRSTHNCIYSIWHLSNCNCYLSLSWMSWNSSKSSTIAAGSSYGLTSTRCCRYSCMYSWWWVEIPPETCRAVFMLIPCIDMVTTLTNSSTHYTKFMDDKITLKIHIKTHIIATPTCFGNTKEPSSGGEYLCLAKVTCGSIVLVHMNSVSIVVAYISCCVCVCV